MKSLYLRIWLTVVLALALFALVSGWLWQRHLAQERAGFEAAASERVAAWADLVQRSLPGADAPAAEQAAALREWSQRLRLPMALDDVHGVRIGTAESFLRREAEGGPRAISVRLGDGRTLWIARRNFRRPLGGRDAPLAAGRPWPAPGMAGSAADRVGAPHVIAPALPAPGDGERRPAESGGAGMLERQSLLPFALPFELPAGLPPAVGPALLLGLLFVAVAAGAYPVVRRLTRRLEALQQGVETFGAGALGHRVDASGHDEVAAVADTFNRAAARIEVLVRSHQSLLANASHELRSPLARLKMALAMLAAAPAEQQGALRHEIDTDIAELDALVEEVLLASRLDTAAALERSDRVDLLGAAIEEGARIGADVDGAAIVVSGDERLLRRALRNLLENARRHGGGDVDVRVERGPGDSAQVRVCDRGPGVPEALRERIFEPFFRVPGHAENAGGVGLGLSLVRQIAERHGGSVRCEPRAGGGSCFVLRLPATP